MARNIENPPKSVNVATLEAARIEESGRRQTTRRTEQLAVLSLAIGFSLVGFVFHILWIAAVVLLALLWGYMAFGLN